MDIIELKIFKIWLIVESLNPEEIPIKVFKGFLWKRPRKYKSQKAYSKHFNF